MHEQDIDKLLKSVGPIAKPSKQMMSTVQTNVEQAWLEIVAKRKSKQRWLYLRAAAASIIVVVGLVVFVLQTDLYRNRFNTLSDQQVAALVHYEGDIKLNHHTFQGHGPLLAGSTVATGNGRISFTLADNTLVNLDKHTELHLANHNTIQLEHGRIYLDSPDTNTSVNVVTSWGNVRDIGTQYEIDVKSTLFQVAMRTGKVVVELDDKTLYAGANNGIGEVVKIDKDNNTSRRTIAANDDHWDWTFKGYDDFSVDQKTVYQTLQWASRVTGKPVIYESEDIEQQARKTKMAGGYISAASIEKSLPNVLGVTLLSAQVNKNAIIVSVKH